MSWKITTTGFHAGCSELFTSAIYFEPIRISICGKAFAKEAPVDFAGYV
jgi:hypothetical protein